MFDVDLKICHVKKFYDYQRRMQSVCVLRVPGTYFSSMYNCKNPFQAEWTNKKLVWVADEEQGFVLAQMLKENPDGSGEVKLQHSNKIVQVADHQKVTIP